MSNGSFPPTSRRPRTALVILAVLLLVCAAGWLVWSAVAHDGSAGDDHAGPAAPHGRTTAPGSGPSGAAGSDDRGSGGSGERPLEGKVVVIDPGHNPHNGEHSAKIARLVDVGTHKKECDTAGATTNSGYTEAAYTLDVSRRVRELLEARGAEVTLTQDGDRPYGPCVDERARIGNRAHADAVVSVHADGSAAGNRGFHVIAPARVRGGKADTSAITGPSRTLADRLIARFGEETGADPANYLGGGRGLTVRDDLGGLNLSTVPKVFIECGNMRDPKDATLLTDEKWRERAARGIAAGITDFLQG
ncbi:N-acetylmuramoyl-L-alanine amidase [Streptomyces sp. NPDC018031]|uniref:N-acetylmuramoyl-L-alanine amidase n=1 Tax=Streptomyces sp. NPDC018031 TaxID=3365033 RepID=UPI00379B09FE